MSIELWSRLPPPNSVGTAQLRSRFILGDDTEVTETSTSYVEKKKFNFYKDTAVETLNWQEMEVVAELKSSATTVTASVAVFVDAEATPRLELTSTSTTYEIKRGTFSMADLPTGLHTISIRCKVSAAGTMNQRHLEIQAKL
jgi:hypothetical protein